MKPSRTPGASDATPRSTSAGASVAVALHYSGTGAPRVIAKGRGEVAAAILEKARQHGIPLKESQDLVEILATIDLGEQIPEALYRAVAEVIAFAWSLKGQGVERLTPERKPRG